jgi:hypothetical protein
MDKNLRHWDNNLKEDNLEDGVFLLEQLESVILDDDDHVEMPPPSTFVVPMSRIPATALGALSSALPQPSTYYFYTTTMWRPTQYSWWWKEDGIVV